MSLKAQALAFIAALLAFAIVPAAASAGTPDQDQASFDNIQIAPTGTTLVAQTFTAGLNGQLDQVDLRLGRNGDPAGDLTVEIRETSGGVPTANVLDTAIVPELSVPIATSIVPIALNAPSVAGTQYSIVLTGPPPTGSCDPGCYGWSFDDDGDPYASGELLVGFNNGANWNAQTGDDAVFKTYVDTTCQTPDGVDAGYFEAVLGDSPAGYWRLGESTGPTAFDSSGNARHGTYAGALTLGEPGAIAGDSDTAADFSPDPKNRVTTPYNPFQANSTRTFEGWACRAENQGFDVLFSGDKRFNSPGLWTDHGDTDRIWFDPRREGGSGPRFWDAAMPPDGDWFHWVLVFNDTANTAELFINSVSQGVRSVTEPYHAFPGNFQIGNYAQINEAWNGPLDEVAVYERALTLEEICVHYTSGIGAPDCAILLP